MSELSEDLLRNLSDYIDREVRAGFSPVGDIPDGAVAYLSDDAPADSLRPYAEQYTAEALVRLSEDEKAWPARTDCDRLDGAFAALEANGIVARQNFTCCQTCGHADIWDEMKAVRDGGREVRGYTFFHWQDTEAAVEGSGLCLAYGATGEGEQAALGVGDAIVAELRAAGLEATWPRDLRKRISVRIDWKKRR